MLAFILCSVCRFKFSNAGEWMKCSRCCALPNREYYCVVITVLSISVERIHHPAIQRPTARKFLLGTSHKAPHLKTAGSNAIMNTPVHIQYEDRFSEETIRFTGYQHLHIQCDKKISKRLLQNIFLFD
jgi:hypothetical protein